jgi:hypothetical protein
MQTYKMFGGSEAVVDNKLGYVEGLDDEEMDKLFERIKEKMRSFAQSQLWRFTMILLTGTRVGEVRFKETLRGALEGIVAAQALKDIEKALLRMWAGMHIWYLRQPKGRLKWQKGDSRLW